MKGFTFLIVMFSMVFIGIVLGMTGRQWKLAIQREKEAELLFRGDQIRDAIENYYKTATAGFNQYPKDFEELLGHSDSLFTRRYLRKPYKDPITGGDWKLIKVGDRLKGVRSTSLKEPLKKMNFSEEYKMFEGKSRYTDWVFEYNPIVVP